MRLHPGPCPCEPHSPCLSFYMLLPDALSHRGACLGKVAPAGPSHCSVGRALCLVDRGGTWCYCVCCERLGHAHAVQVGETHRVLTAFIFRSEIMKIKSLT